MSDNLKQLYRKSSNGSYPKIFPLAFVQGIKDYRNDKELLNYIDEINHFSVNYNENPETTRCQIDAFIRKKGLYITYYNTDTNENITEYFKGNQSDVSDDTIWGNSDNWELVPDKSYIESHAVIPNKSVNMNKLADDVIQAIGDSGLSADEEDLTDRNSILKFKDKEYNAEEASGLGYKILRKNWVEDKNILTQDMISDENTIYEIRYDFDLNGEEITIPEECVLKFNGGSLNNGTLIGNNTQIITNNIHIFTNINIDGIWFCSKISSAWFTDEEEENVLRNVIALSRDDIYNEITIENGEHLVSTEYSSQIGGGIAPKSNTHLILIGDIKIKPNNHRAYYIIDVRGKESICISGNGKIIGDKDEHTGDSGEWGHGINIVDNCKNIEINGLHIEKCWGDAIYVSDTQFIKINNCELAYCRRQGISITDNVSNVVIQNNYIHNIAGTDPQAGIDIEPNEDSYATEISVIGNKIEDCRSGVIANTFFASSTVDNVIIQNNWVKNTIVVGIRFYGDVYNENNIYRGICIIEGNHIINANSGRFLQVIFSKEVIVNNNTFDTINADVVDPIYFYFVNTLKFTNNTLLNSAYFGRMNDYPMIITGNHLCTGALSTGPKEHIVSKNIFDIVLPDRVSSFIGGIVEDNTIIIKNSVIPVSNPLQTYLKVFCRNIVKLPNLSTLTTDKGYLFYNLYDGVSIIMDNIFISPFHYGIISNINSPCAYDLRNIRILDNNDSRTFVNNSKYYSTPQLVCATSERDTYLLQKKVGAMYFDTTIGKPVFWNGTNYVDAIGNVI